MAKFSTDIYTLLTKDTSLNAMISNMYYESIPVPLEQLGTNEVVVVFKYNKTDDVNVLGLNSFMKVYRLELNVIAKNTLKANDVTDKINSFILNAGDASARLINFESVNSTMASDLDLGLYVNNLTYDCTYCL